MLPGCGRFPRTLRSSLLAIGCAALLGLKLLSAQNPQEPTKPPIETPAPPGAPQVSEQRPEKAKEPAERAETLHIGGNSFVVRLVGNASSAIRYVVPHGDEETAPQAAIEHLQRHDGLLIQLVNPRERLIKFRVRGRTYEFDPNRIFTPTGLRQNVMLLNPQLKRLGPRRKKQVLDEVQRFSEELLRLIVEPRAPGLSVIAVHNSGTSPRSNFSLETFLNPDGYFQGVEAVNYRRARTPYNLFLVTVPTDFEELKKRDLNVVLESSDLAADDGSLSVYCGKAKIRYANVETRLGELKQQVEMLETLREIWDAAAKTEAEPTAPAPRQP